MELEQCQVERTDPVISLPPPPAKSRICFSNPNRRTVFHYEIDGCVHAPGTPETRCDYLLIDQDGTEHFIEFKGKDVMKAIDQIDATIRRWGKPGRPLRYGYIVCSKSPPRINSKYLSAKVRMRENLNCILDKKENFPEIPLPRV